RQGTAAESRGSARGSAEADEAEGPAAEGEVNRRGIMLALGRWGECHRRSVARPVAGVPGAVDRHPCGQAAVSIITSSALSNRHERKPGSGSCSSLLLGRRCRLPPRRGNPRVRRPSPGKCCKRSQPSGKPPLTWTATPPIFPWSSCLLATATRET